MNTSLIYSDPLVNISRVIGGTIRGTIQERNVTLVRGDQEITLPQAFIDHFPTIENLRERLDVFSQEPNRAFKVSMGCKAISGLLYGAYYGLQATSGVTPLVSQLFVAKVVGYPLSDGMDGYASAEQLKILKQVGDLEGINIQKGKIAGSVSSFLGGVFLTGGEIATICGATTLSAILSFTMLPLYALGFSASCIIQGKKILSSRQFKKDLEGVMSSENLSQESLKKGLEHIKNLITPSEQALNEIVEELGKETIDKQFIERKLTEYKDEQFKKFQELERRVGSSAANELIEKLDDVLAKLENGNLEEATKLLATIEKGTSREILKAALSILVGLVILAVFISTVMITHGATLSLLL